ncbi:MAG: DUF2442 domain-containing protein [Bacteroidales bacterium]|nr:DUF2442 domain-containing protein [Bacteroidales bacterium]MBP5722490.1 DUF2442 domain-containing protein [Bacteroidales bacterium]
MKQITVKSVAYVSPLCVQITYSDGFTNVVNIGDFIKRHPHPQYNKYLDEKNFKKFKIEMGNVVWGKNWDIIFPVGALYAGNLELCCDEVAF